LECNLVLDVIPMILQRLDWYANTSAFVQWLILGVIINHLQIGLKGWLKGCVVAVIAGIPIMILVAKSDVVSILPIAIMSVILGSLVGSVGEKFKL
jgi:hypothetical protein